MVMDGWCTTPGEGPGRTNQEDCADVFNVFDVINNRENETEQIFEQDFVLHQA